MVRKAFVMSVREGCEAEYERRHRPIWPELAEVLKEHGVANYSIFLHSETRQLFGYAEIDNETQWRAIASTEVCQRWWRSMASLMPTVPGTNEPESVALREVFHLDGTRSSTGRDTKRGPSPSFFAVDEEKPQEQAASDDIELT